ncbi:hypothetical protein ACWDZ8_10365 [Streptomyces sp. NPDC003233]
MDTLLARMRPDLALRRWMDCFADHVEARGEMGDALRALIDADVLTVVRSRERLAVEA